MTHSLPAKSPDSPLSTFTGFFRSAMIQKNGDVVVQFVLDKEQAAAVLDLAGGDGMALNVSVWETELPEGDEEFAKLLGIGTEGEDG